MNNFLKYGDLILFYGEGIRERGNTLNSIEANGGALSAIGLTDTGVYYQNFPSTNNGNPFTLESKLNFSNLSDCVYRITPKLNFDFHKDFKKTLKFFKNLQRALSGAKDKDRKKLESLKDSLEARLIKLKDRIKKEQLLNDNIVNDSLDQVITYGSEVQLMHYNSKSFIKGRNDCSQTENIGYNCELSNWYSSGMVFKILPKFKSRQDGDVIQLRDHIILKNMKHDAYISIARELPLFEDLDYGEHTNPYLPKVSVFDERCKRYMIYLSQESNSAFQIVLYRKNTSVHGDELLGGDIVKITHTEIQADLTANICYGDDGYEVFMRNYHGEFGDENSSLASYWVMEHENFENAGENFKIKITEDKIRSKSTVRLRHFISGCLVMNRKVENALKDKANLKNDEKKIVSCFLQTDSSSDEYIQIDLEPVVKSSNLLINKNTYFLTSSNDMKFLKYNRKDEAVDYIVRDNGKLLSKLKKRDEKYQFYPLEDEDLSEKKYRSVFSEEFSSEDAYTIERMPFKSKFGCLIVRSMLPILYNITSVFKKGQKRKGKKDIISSEKYLQIQETLKKMICFLFDIDTSDDVDYFEIEDNPIEERQKILKDFGIIDILVELLYYPFRNNIYTLQKLEMDSYFAKTLELTYTSIRYTIAEYRPNELYSSQWIGLIMEQSMHTSGKNDIKAGQTLTELIDNNEKILESRIEKETIQNFIKFLCEEDKDAKFLNILRAICICNDEPMMQNQKEISELMLQDKKVMKELLFSIHREPEGLFISLQIKDYEHIPLEELEDISIKDNNKKKVYNYFLAMVKLLSDLCKDRNYLAIDILQKKFPFDICFDIMRGNYSCSIREVFTSLLKNLWIDVSPFQNINFPVLIKIWDEIENQDVFKDVEKKDHNQYKDLKVFIIAHLKSMKSKMSGNYGSEKSRLDYSILNLTETMFNLGFLTDIDEINEVISSLMKYLGTDKSTRNRAITKSFTKSITMFNSGMAERSRDSTLTEVEEEFEEEDLKLIECKKKVCNILSFILKIQDQLRIINFLTEFKILVQSIEKSSPGLLGSLITPENYLKHNLRDSKLKEKIKIREQKKNEIIEKMDQLVDDIVKRKTKIHLKEIHSFKSKLFELIMYKDLSLKTCALDLIGKIHSKNQILGDTIFLIQIIDDPSSKINYQKAKSAAFTLNNIGDTIENWYNDSESKEMRSLVVILNSIYKGLMNQLKTEDNLLDMRAIEEVQKDTKMALDTFQFKKRRPRPTGTYLEIKSDLSDIHQYMLDSSGEKIDTFEQELFRNSGIYIGFIKMLQFDAETENNNRTASQKAIIRKMYRILAKSVKSSDVNKQILTKYLEGIILEHYRDATADLNAYFLLKQIIINNKEIILNKVSVKNIVETVCQNIERLDNNSIEKSYSLSILTDLMKYKEYILKSNQNIVLAKVISKEFKNIMIDFDNKDFEKDLKNLGKTKNLTSHVRTIQGNKVLVLPEKICYIMSYLNLLTICTEDKNAFSENICQNLLNLDSLNKFILYSDLIIVLKQSILNYFYHVFLDTERDIPFHIMEIFLNILKIICEDFEFYARKKYLEIEDSIESYDDLSILSFDSFKSFNQWIVDYLVILIKSFTNIIKRNLNLIPDSKPARFYNDFLMKLINFSHITYMKYDNEEIKQHLDLMLMEIYNNHQDGKISDQLRQKHRRVIKNTVNEDEPNANTDSRLQVSNNRSEHRRRSRLKSSKPSTMSLFPKIEYLIDLYFNNDLFKKRCYEEFSEIIKILNKIQLTSSFSSEITGGELVYYQNIDFKKFCTSLMKYLSPSNEEADNKLRILGLRIFRNYIERNCRDLKEEKLQDHYPLVDWEVENWNDIIPILTSRQNRLCKFKIIQLICGLFTSINDLNVIKEILLLSIALLFGGNKEAQDTFYEFFMNDSYSLFLNKLKNVMMEAFEIVRKNMRQKNNKVMKNYYKKYGVDKNKFSIKQNEEIERMHEIKAEVEKVDSNYQICRYIFKFLQLLCEGHNQDLQNLLREQRENTEFSSYKSINFISSTATLWGSYIKFVNPECVKLGDMMLDFLIESIQGPCIQNQMELYRNKIIDFSKDFMNDFSSDRDYKSRGFVAEKEQELDNLISQNIKMLYSLMEANQDKQIYINMGQNIDFNSLKKKLTSKFLEIFENVVPANPTDIDPEILEKHIRYTKVFKEGAEEAFDIFFFIQTINDRTGKYKEPIKALKGPDLIAYNFFEKHSAHIEIVFKGKSDIHKVYFMIQPACRYLDDNQKTSFIENVDIDRTTANEKITYFMNHAPKLFDRMDRMSNLSSKCSSVSQNSFKWVRDLCLYTVIAINLFVFIFYEIEVQNNVASIKSVSFNDVFIQSAGILHLVLSVLMLIMWLTLNRKLILMDGWRKEFNKHKKSLNHFLANYTGMDSHSIELSFNKTLIDLTQKEKIRMIRFINKAQGFKYSIAKLQYFFQNINFILSNNTFKYFSFYICLSVIALWGNVVILYSIHMLDIINRFDTLGNVIRAITHNKKQLVLTAFLMVILLYLYALFAFTYVDDTFFTTSVEPSGESMCHTLLQCFTTVTSLGPRSSGSVGDVLLRPSYQDGQINRLRYYIRWIYDVSIFFIVNIICMKLIFGIIIDTFAELRDKKTVTDYDKDNICFICSLDRYVFDKNADGFENHTKRDHNVWNYLYFMYSLKKKDSTGFNGIESYVEHKMQIDDISWIPMKQALRIKKVEAEKDNLESKILLINEEIEKIEKKLNMSDE